METMKLWNAVSTTDPATTKRVNQRGGFTAIDAQSQIKKATDAWGPYGQTWGVKELNYEFMGDAVLLSAVFWYPDGEFPMMVDAAWKIGQDVTKKMLTDFTTKALSKLGFNSDVFEGKFDDNKYVAAQREKSQKPSPEKDSPETKEPLLTYQDGSTVMVGSSTKAKAEQSNFTAYVKDHDGVAPKNIHNLRNWVKNQKA